MPDEILLPPEVAELLKISHKTVYTLIQKGQLPAFKVLEQWLHKRVDNNRWIEAQKTIAKVIVHESVSTRSKRTIKVRARRGRP